MEELDDCGCSEINYQITDNLLKNHIYFLSGPITTQSATEFIKWIISENLSNYNQDLTVYINSEGGSLSAALAIVDIMKTSKLPIKTIGIGDIHSAGFLIFSCGTKGKRIVSKNISAMMHQCSTGFAGKEHEIKAQYKELELASQRIIKILMEVTGFSEDRVKELFQGASDGWMTPEELIEYNIADEVV